MNWGHRRIASELSSERISFDGQLRADSLLLTASGALQEFSGTTEACDPLVPSELARLYGPLREDWSSFVLGPCALVLVQVGERLELRGAAVGIIGTLSHVARIGLMAHLESPFVAPNFAGFLTLEVFNASPTPIRLSRGLPLAKLTLWDVDGHVSEVHQPAYGESGRLRSHLPSEFRGIAKEAGHV